MSFRLFLKCCLHSKAKEERKTELDVKRVIFESKDNSFDKSGLDVPSIPTNNYIKEPQQSPPIVEESVKPNETHSSPPPIQQTAPENPPIKEEVKANIEPINSIKEVMAHVPKTEEGISPDGADKNLQKLLLRIIESNVLVKDSVIKIFPSGYKESKRKILDGNVYFGAALEGKSQGETYINDFVLPSEENGCGKRHFVITYNNSKPITQRKIIIISRT